MSGALKRDEWETVRLGDVCDKVERVSPKSFSEIYYVDISSIDRHSKSVSSPQRIRFETAPASARQLLKKTDILISTVRPNLNAVAIHETDSDIPTIGSTALCVLRCCDTISFRYVFHFTQSDYFIKPLVNVATGACYPTVKNRDVLNVEIPLPPLDIQRRIAETLDKVTELITLRKTQLEKLDELVKARFVEMFGDPKYNKSILVKIGEIGALTSGGTPSRAKPEYFEGDIRWYSAGELNSLYLPDSVEHISETALQQSSAKLFSKGTLMIGMYDTAAFKLGILTEDSSSNQACANLNPKRGYNIVWLYYLFDIMKPIFLQERQGVRQKNLSLSKIKEFEVPFAPFELQEQFAAFVKQINKAKAPIQQSLDTLETLKKSLMQEYFG